MRITQRIALATMSISLLLLLTIGGVSYLRARHLLRHEVETRLAGLVRLQGERIRDIMDHNRERLRLVSSRTRLRIILGHFVDEPAEQARGEMRRILADARDAAADFHHIHVVLPDGTVAVSTDPSVEGGRWGGDGQALERGLEGVYIDSLLLGEGGVLMMRLSGPLKLEGRLLGAVIIESDVTSILAMVRDYSALGSTGETELGRWDDGEALVLTPLRFDPDAALRHRIPRGNADAPLVQALDGASGVVANAVDYRGRPVLAAVAHIDDPGWGVVVKMDQSEAYGPANDLRNVFLVIIAASAFVLAGLTWLVARTITRPIRRLTQVARKVREGNFDVRANVVGHDETTELAQAFDSMADDLTRDISRRKQAEDALVQAQADLEERVRKRTAELEQANEALRSEIAERKRAEEELAGKSEQLEESNEELQQFAYVASHDLQEPLRMITGFVQLFARRYGGEIDEKADEYIHFITDGVERMQRLIDDLLAYSRVTTRGNPMRPVDAGKPLEEALQNLQAAIDEAGAEVTHSELPHVCADGTQLMRVFQNLIANAVKFHGDGPPRIHVDARLCGRQWVFSVSDNGIGIPQKDLDGIFTIFRRLHAREEYSGTGIGLAVCRRIINRHEGRIWAESEEGKGSTFYFSLDAAGDGDGDAPCAPATEESPTE